MQQAATPEDRRNAFPDIFPGVYPYGNRCQYVTFLFFYDKLLFTTNDSNNAEKVDTTTRYTVGVSWSLTSLFSTNMAISEPRYTVGNDLTIDRAYTRSDRFRRRIVRAEPISRLRDRDASREINSFPRNQ